MMSDASFVTSYEDQQLGPCVDQSVQCDLPAPAPPKYHDSVRNHHRKLQRYHTSDQLFERRAHLPYTRAPGRPSSRLKFESQYNSRPRSLAFADSYPFFTARSGQFYSDSGYGTVGSRRSRYCYQSSDSPTFSLTPPNSLDYLCVKGERSPAGSVTPSGMNSAKSQGAGVYLNPGYLQVPFPNSQAGSETPAGEGGCRNCRTQHDSASGLSWRRLHMSRAKLKATATTSELLSGFAMVAMVELQINEPTNVPEWLFVMFAICTTVLVAVHIFALMISTYLLPNIDAVSKMAEGGDDLVHESPHERMRGFIELAWAFSTVLGLFLFLVEIAILCWVKFWDYSFAAATAATVIVIPVLIVFVAFAIHFYHSLVVHKCESSNEDMVQLESMKRNLDSATIKAGSPV